MTRNRERRSFTVAAKSSGHHGFVSIPAKAPRVPQEGPRKPAAVDPWAAVTEPPRSVAPASRPEAEPRRILPNLIAWEAPEPEREPSRPVEPRVRRAASQGGHEDAPRRRGRPRKHPLPLETSAPAARAPDTAPVPAPPRAEPAPAKPMPMPMLVQRKERPSAETLRLGERWKRRLPRSCW